MPSARDIAKYLLMLGAQASGESAAISSLKLQKLVYYAQGYHLAMYDRCLFDEKIAAWKHGPVVAELYREYREFEASSIPCPQSFEPGVLAEGVRRFLDDVFADVGHFSAWDLRAMTHHELPWIQTYDGVKDTEIEVDVLRRFFKERFIGELGDIAERGDAVLREVIEAHADLPLTIHFARRELNRRFGPDAPMILRGRSDPEEDYQYASLHVQTALAPGRASELRDDFDEAWWLARVNDSVLVVNFELV